ncbi:MAG: DNA polymerase IV [Alphaproteobacteria bacterium]|nr:DNA polymerase IV [Alphaproteobacteria bacterium]
MSAPVHGAGRKLPLLCRDCLQTGDSPPSNRCPHCASPRILRHGELDDLAIAHIDCDAFYAAVEKRDNPALRDKPVIVGGGRRGVVSTCCYIARINGVRSAMPMFKALNLCPDAIVIRPDMAKYAAVGRQVRDLMLELTPQVEPLSIDEAFLDLAGTRELHRASPALTLARFARRVETELGITVSAGLSYCKFLAKIASDLDKPRGFAVIGKGEARTFLASKPVGLIWGVGKVAQERLQRDGFATIGDIQAREESDLMRLYGAEGQRLWRLARGEDTRRVSPDRDMKSVSAETTFDRDISDPQELTRTLLLLAEKVSARMKAKGVAGSTVTLKLKTADFAIRTRARALPEPTQLATRIFDTARELLLRETTGTKFRLIGVGLSSLGEPESADQGDLVNTGVKRARQTEQAIDALRAKFGQGAVVRGLVFGKQRLKDIADPE